MIIDLLFDVIDFPNDYRPNDLYARLLLTEPPGANYKPIKTEPQWDNRGERV